MNRIKYYENVAFSIKFNPQSFSHPFIVFRSATDTGVISMNSYSSFWRARLAIWWNRKRWSMKPGFIWSE